MARRRINYTDIRGPLLDATVAQKSEVRAALNVIPVPAPFLTLSEYLYGVDPGTKFLSADVERYMDKASTIAYASTVTIDWSGTRTADGNASNSHSMLIGISITGNCTIRVGAIHPGLKFQRFLIEVTNANGGAKTVSFDTWANGAYVTHRPGVSNPGIGSDAGNRLVIEGYIRAPATVGGIVHVTDYEGFGDSATTGTPVGLLLAITRDA